MWVPVPAHFRVYLFDNKMGMKTSPPHRNGVRKVKNIERSLALAPWEIRVCLSLPPWKWGLFSCLVSRELMRSTNKVTQPHHLRAFRGDPVFLQGTRWGGFL